MCALFVLKKKKNINLQYIHLFYKNYNSNVTICPLTEVAGTLKPWYTVAYARVVTQWEGSFSYYIMYGCTQINNISKIFRYIIFIIFFVFNIISVQPRPLKISVYSTSGRRYTYYIIILHRILCLLMFFFPRQVFII